MAQVIRRTIRTGVSNAAAAIDTDLESVFDFVRITDGKMYISEKVWFEVYGYSNSFAIKLVHDDLGQYFYYSQNNISSSNCSITYEIVKTLSGDVLFSLHYAQNTFTPVADTKLAIVKVKNSAGTEQYAIYTSLPQNSTSTTFSLSATNSKFILIADDNSAMGTTTTSDTTSIPETAPSYTNELKAGWHLDCVKAKLIPVFNTYTDFMTEYARIAMVTPQPYYGRCLVGNVHYFFSGFLALLDESVS